LVPGGPVQTWPGSDDSRIVGLKLIFLIVSRTVSLLRLSRRESWWKDAEVLMCAQFRVQRRDRAGGVIHEYRLVA
jgi:hypothetical protein